VKFLGQESQLKSSRWLEQREWRKHVGRRQSHGMLELELSESLSGRHLDWSFSILVVLKEGSREKMLIFIFGTFAYLADARDLMGWEILGWGILIGRRGLQRGRLGRWGRKVR